jgi:hypothetical protein
LTYPSKICFKQILCHPAESNCGHTDFQSVALPTELGWQYEYQTSCYANLFFKSFRQSPGCRLGASGSIIRPAILAEKRAWRIEFNAPGRICQLFIQMNFKQFTVAGIGISL